MSPVGAAPLIYLITDRHATAGRPLDAVIAQALRALPRAGVAGSALAVQLREKDLEGRALLELARRLRASTAAVGARLFVNDRVDVALAAGADGVHLGGGALTVDDVHSLAPALQIAVSTHGVGEVRRAADDGRVSFVVFGPVFDTPSKRAFGPPLGLGQLGAAAAASALPVLALGGVTRQTLAACFSVGARGVGCVRPILGSPDPEAALRGFFGAIEST